MYKLDNNVEWTEELKNAFKTGTTRAKIIYDGNQEINETNMLKSLELKDTQYVPSLGFIGQACSKELTFSFVNSEGINLENKELTLKIGAEYNGDVYYITYGNFIVCEAPHNDKTNNVTSVVANDYMIKFDVPYEDTITYPCTLKELAQNICDAVGVELGSEEFSNSDFVVVDNQFEGSTAKEVIKNIAKSAFSWARIGQDNKLYFDLENGEEKEEEGTGFTLENPNYLQGGSIIKLTNESESTVVEGTSFELTDIDANKKHSIIKLEGNTTQQKLPDNYQEVEYIQSSGTQYIDTGVSPTSDTGFTIEYQEGTGTGTKTLIGSGTSAAVGYIGISRNGTQIQAYWGKPNNVTSYTFTFDTKHKLKFNLNSDRKVVMDGTEIYTLATTPETTITTNTMTLFAFKYSSIVQYANALKLYSCQIYNNSTLVRSFIPCYRKSDNVIGLYDLVNNSFYTNNGTGTFAKGNNITTATPTPDNPIEIETVSGDNEVVVCGENMLPQDKYITSRTINGITYTNNGDGTFSLSGTATATTSLVIIPVGNLNFIESGQPYYLYSSQPYNNMTFNMCIFMQENGTNKYLIANSTYTPNGTLSNIRMQFYIQSGKTVNAENIQMMLVKGSTAPTTYEPYTGNSYRVDFGGKNKFTGDVTSVSNGSYSEGVVTGTGVNCFVNFVNNTISVKSGETIYFSADIRLTSGSTGSFNALNDGTNVNTKVVYPTLNTTFQRYQTKLTYSSDFSIHRLLFQTSSLSGSVEIKNIMISTSPDILYSPYVANPLYFPEINGYKNKLKRAEGKNLFEVNRSNGSSNTFQLTVNADKTVTVTGGNSTVTYFNLHSGKLPIEANTQYTISRCSK